MNKCQHGQRIIFFCGSQQCQWKQASGCQTCMKKYHNHHEQLILSEDQAQQLIKRYGQQSKVKPKCRQLQQLICQYINSFKNQLNSSLELLNKNMVNQIGYPFLNLHSLLSAFKKLKKKEYKRVVQKDFGKLYQLSTKINDSEFQKQESKAYIENIKYCTNIIGQIQSIRFQVHQIIVKINDVFSFQKTTHQKLHYLLTHINEAQSPSKLKGQKYQKINIKNSSKHDDNDKKNILINNIKAQIQSKIPIIKQNYKKQAEQNKNNLLNVKHTHTRDVSLQQKIIVDKNMQLLNKNKKIDKIQNTQHIFNNSLNTQKLQHIKFQLNNKQQSLFQKKKIVLDIMKSKDQQQSARKTSFNNQESSDKKQFDSPTFITKNQSKINKNNSVSKKLNININQIQDIPQNQPVLSRAFTILPLPQNNKKVVVPPLPNLKQLRNINKPTEQYQNQQKKRQLSQDTTQTKPSMQIIKKDSPKKQISLSQEQLKSSALLMKSLNASISQSINMLQMSINLSQNNMTAFERLSQNYLIAGRWKDCLSLCNRFLQKIEDTNISSKIIILNKAIALNQLGRYSQAINIIDQHQQLKKTKSSSRIQADAYFNIGKYQKALSLYSQCDSQESILRNIASCQFMIPNIKGLKLTIKHAYQLGIKDKFWQQISGQLQKIEK